MDLQLHHVAVACDEIEESLSFYRDKLGLQVVGRFFQEGIVDMAMLSDRAAWPTFLLALHGPPFEGWRQDDYNTRGSQMNALGFVSSDFDDCVMRLSRTNLEVVESIHPCLPAQVVSARDPAGIHVELLGFGDAAQVPKATSLSRSASGRSDIGVEYWLSSVSLNCRNTAEITNEKHFYTEDLSLELIRDNPDLVMLADSRVGPQAGLELFVSESHIWADEGVFITDHGPGLHYLCFRVANTNAAHRDLVQKGVVCTGVPAATEHYEWATYLDPSGIDIAISSTPWPQWGDGFKDHRAPAHRLHRASSG